MIQLIFILSVFWASPCLSSLILSEDTSLELGKKFSKNSKISFESDLEKNLYFSHKYFLSKKYRKCLSYARALKENPSFSTWSSIYLLRCLRGKKNTYLLKKELNLLKKNSSWMKQEEVDSRILKKEYLLSLFHLSDKNIFKKSYLKRLYELRHLLNKKQKKTVYKKLSSFYKKRPSILKNYKKNLNIKDPKKISKEEKDAFIKIITEKKPFLKVKKSSIFLSDYSDSFYEKKVLEQMRSVFFKSKKKSVRKSLRVFFNKLSDSHIESMIKVFFKYAYYPEILFLYEKKFSGKKKTGSSRSLWMICLATHYLGDYEKSVYFKKKFLKFFPSSSLKRQIQFHLALSYLRLNQKKQAYKHFFSLVRGVKNTESFVHQSLYHLSFMDSSFSSSLIKNFPMTYYSLKKRALEKIKIPEKSPIKKKYTWHLEAINEERFFRFKTFLKIGLFQEAEKEMDFILKKNQSVEKLWILNHLLSKTPFYLLSFRSLSLLMEKKPGLFSLNLLKKSFPYPHLSWIKKYAKKYQLKPSLILSLIRQESAFNKDAKSIAGALGLMQIIPSTGKQMASYLRIKSYKRSFLRNPKINIRLGTYYFFRLYRYFKKNVHVSLAAYNVGFGRVKKWTSYRKKSSLKSLKKSLLWIDELPWSETSFYIKAVMRNEIIYSEILKKP